MIYIKRRWLFIYAIYLDVLFLENFILEGVSLLGVGIWQKSRLRWHRILLAALLGSAGGAAVFLLCHDFLLYLVLLFGVMQPAILQVAYGKHHIRELLEQYLRLILVYWLLGGILSAADLLIPECWKDLLLPLGCLVLVVAIFLAVGMQKRKCAFKRAAILVNGHVERMDALADTGNLLMDGVSGCAVCVVSERYKDIWELSEDRLRRIPYETVAGWSTMEVVTADQFLLEKGGEMIQQKEILIGFGKDALFRGKGYQMILQKDFCWE